MNRKLTLALVALLALVAVPAGASAHVTLQPEDGAPGEYAVFAVRVPNESENATTTRVAVSFPPGFEWASYEPVAGWRAEVSTYGEEVDGIVWTATGPGVGPGEFVDFPIEIQVPEKPGAALAFRTVQTYDDGEVARWAGGPEAEMPAPQLTVSVGEAAQPDRPDDSDDSGDTLAIVALVVGALGLLAGAAALLRSRRSG
ncbi:MAG TPA: YcnI family protein [Solirubrobacterales bacterium]|nr:YcnI family protein [Solirubrobacterales bacterium]